MRRIPISPTSALIVAAAAIAVLLVLWWPRSSPSLFTSWGGVPPPGAVSGIARAVPTVAAGVLIVAASDGLYVDQRPALQSDLETALAYVTDRFGSGMHAPVTAALVSDDGCSLGGIAYTDIRRVQVTTCDAIPRARAISILAHEFTHQLAQDRYGAAHLRADLILSEGVATWAAGRYWLSGKPDFRSFVREQRRNGQSYPLATSYIGLGVEAMNTLYYEWASFVEFLIQTYGREAFDQAYTNGANTPGSAAYQRAFGKDLPTLEREWERWIDQP